MKVPRRLARIAGIAALLPALPQQALAGTEPVACADLATQFPERAAASFSCKKLD